MSAVNITEAPIAFHKPDLSVPNALSRQGVLATPVWSASRKGAVPGPLSVVPSSLARLVTGLPLLLALAITSFAQSKPAPAVLSEEEIRKILVERIDAQHQSVGIVVGVITPEGRRIVTYGRLAQGDPRTLNGDTIFEIGSATKVFTSLLLADMVQHSQAALDDPVAKYL